MRKTKYILAALMLSATGAYAQYTNSGYFTEGYTYRHQLNPAFANEKNFISLPALGNTNLGIVGDINLQDYIYNIDGKTTTFLNPKVDAGEFLSNIDDENELNFDTRFQILSAGFKGFGGYNTIGLSMRGNLNTMLPKSLFVFAKEGIANRDYDISHFGIHTTAYAELALGHSRQINEKLRVGANLKFLVGLANIDAEFNKANFRLGEDQWTAVTNAEIQASVKGLKYETELSDYSNTQVVNDVDLDGFGMNGFGMAVDLGAEYKLNDSWSFSAAVLDFGFISWNNNMVATTNGDKTFTTNDYTFSFDEEDVENNFENQVENMGDKLASLYELEDAGDKGGRTKMLGATINLGAEYTLPVYDKLKFGLMNTTRFQGVNTWTEFRLSANVAPVKFFSAGVNVAAGTYGAAFGWIMSIHPKGFNLFAAMDHTLGKVTKEFIPLTSKGSFTLGVNVPF